MKKISVVSVAVLLTFVLSSCSMHLGLHKFLGLSSPTPTKTKHIKATHTPPSPSTAKATPAADTITITSASYQPNNLHVNVGTAVTWINTDATVHAVTSDTAGIFDSGPINTNALFTYTFDQAGTFTYHSNGESGFTGTVVVTQ